MNLKATLKFKKSTKRTHVYEDTSETAPISVLYIHKDSLPVPTPLKLTITVEESK